MDFTVDMREVEGLATQIDAAPEKVVAGVLPIMRRAALNVKAQMQRDFSGIKHAPYFPSSITYDVAVVRDGVVAEIGPDKHKKQGALGNILAFGTSKNQPVADIFAGARAEEPNMEKYLGDLGEQSLG